MSNTDQSPEEIAALKKEQGDKMQITSMLSFLMALVYRAGGKIVIENLSEFSGMRMGVTMNIDEENDRVTLKTVERAEAEGGPE